MKHKVNGQIFTPNKIVVEMLDIVNFSSKNDLSKIKIIDNSCGNGAFLKEIVKRIFAFARIKKLSNSKIKNILEKNVYGIELEKDAYQNCIKSLNNICNKENIKNVDWKIVNANTIDVYKEYENSFDIVIGNPPYVRIHNTVENLKQFNYCQVGMTDLYIAFYEMGIRMLNKNGKLCYINPSSIFNSKAASILRKDIISKKILAKVIDFKHKQLFEKITTYSTIILLNKNHNKNRLFFSNSYQNFITLKYEDIFINQNFYFSKNKKDLVLFKKIITNTKTSPIEVKNGIATLADSVFIRDNFEVKSRHIVNIYKASTGKEKECFFPYDKNFNILKQDQLDLNFFKKYLEKFKDILKKRSSENKKHWWAFGRSQAIKDFYKEKIAINTTIKNTKSVKLKSLKENTLIYSGLYILNANYKNMEILKSDDFINYLSMLSKYKSGGYYSLSSKDLKKYIDYHVA